MSARCWSPAPPVVWWRRDRAGGRRGLDGDRPGPRERPGVRRVTPRSARHRAGRRDVRRRVRCRRPPAGRPAPHGGPAALRRCRRDLLQRLRDPALPKIPGCERVRRRGRARRADPGVCSSAPPRTSSRPGSPAPFPWTAPATPWSRRPAEYKAAGSSSSSDPSTTVRSEPRPCAHAPDKRPSSSAASTVGDRLPGAPRPARARCRSTSPTPAVNFIDVIASAATGYRLPGPTSRPRGRGTVRRIGSDVVGLASVSGGGVHRGGGLAGSPWRGPSWSCRCPTGWRSRSRPRLR